MSEEDMPKPDGDEFQPTTIVGGATRLAERSIETNKVGNLVAIIVCCAFVVGSYLMFKSYLGYVDATANNTKSLEAVVKDDLKKALEANTEAIKGLGHKMEAQTGVFATSGDTIVKTQEKSNRYLSDIRAKLNASQRNTEIIMERLKAGPPIQPNPPLDAPHTEDPR